MQNERPGRRAPIFSTAVAKQYQQVKGTPRWVSFKLRTKHAEVKQEVL